MGFLFLILYPASAASSATPPFIHTQLCHTPSFTHHLCGTCTPSLRQAWHLSTAVLCVAGVAIGDIHLRFAWQAWHLVTSTFVLRGRHGTYGTGLALVARLGALRCAWVRLGALGRAWSPVMPPYFAWQAWHLVTSTFASRGRRGTCHLWHWAVALAAYGTGLALVSRLSTLGRAWARLVAGDAAVLCVAGRMALGDIHLRFAWQAWHLVTSTFVLRGRRGTYLGMALDWLWWRAWARLGALGRR